MSKEYLAWVKDNKRLGTYKIALNCLFPMVHGQTPKGVKIFAGLGEKTANSLTDSDILKFLDAFSNWNCGYRLLVLRNVCTCFNWASRKKQGLCNKLQLKPDKEDRNAKEQARVTYITPEQEEALKRNGVPAFRIALTVLLRTGCRPSEFTNLEHKHVFIDDAGRMKWIYQPSEHKTGHLGKTRIIIVAPEIAEIVKTQMRLSASGRIFHTQQGKEWNPKILLQSFSRAKERATEREGIKFDDDCCLYSTRHTFAKRVLGGYWNNGVAPNGACGGAFRQLIGYVSKALCPVGASL